MTLDGSLPILLALHACASAFMTGLIWFVQVVHYPMFLNVARSGPESLRHYATEHAARTTFVVAPVMLAELAAAAILLAVAFSDSATVASHRSEFQALAAIGAVILAALWISTFAVQVPLHGRIQATGDTNAVATLVASNWIRTVLWTIRGLLSIAMVILAK